MRSWDSPGLPPEMDSSDIDWEGGLNDVELTPGDPPEDDEEEEEPINPEGRMAILTQIPTSTTNFKRPRTLAAGWNRHSRTLSVIFRDGTPYNYYGVNHDTWNKFRAAISKGVFILRYLDNEKLCSGRGFPEVNDIYSTSMINDLMAYAKALQSLHEGIQPSYAGYKQSATSTRRVRAMKVATFGTYTDKSGHTYRSVTEALYGKGVKPKHVAAKAYTGDQDVLKKFYKGRVKSIQTARFPVIPQVEQGTVNL